MSPRKIQVVHVLTTAMGVRGTRGGELRCLSAAGFAVTVLCSPDDHIDTFVSEQGAEFVPIDFEREINPCRDLRALW